MKRTPRLTPAHRALAAWMKERSVTQAKLANALGISREAVSQWLKCGGVPHVQSQRVLDELVGIRFDDWLTKPEVMALDEARERFKRLMCEAA